MSKIFVRWLFPGVQTPGIASPVHFLEVSLVDEPGNMFSDPRAGTIGPVPAIRTSGRARRPWRTVCDRVLFKRQAPAQRTWKPALRKTSYRLRPFPPLPTCPD
ncbi:MAG: hypothetical protein DRP71_04580 [Verrucomicrobia bacterium]|nr:MAG: hypothetical protein DRP71_04580 [Verrucomicrobiota bacterium]